MFGDKNSLPLFVLTVHSSLLSCMTSSTLSFKKNSVLNGFICSNNLSVNSLPVHSGTPGIS